MAGSSVRCRVLLLRDLARDAGRAAPVAVDQGSAQQNAASALRGTFPGGPHTVRSGHRYVTPGSLLTARSSLVSPAVKFDIKVKVFDRCVLQSRVRRALDARIRTDR